MYEFNNLDAATTALDVFDQSDLDQLTAKQKEAVALLKHDHIVEGTMVRALNVGGGVAAKWGKKFVCVIKTRGVDGSFDGNFRIVATSDLHQVHHLEAVKKALKKASRPQTGKLSKVEAALAKQGLSLDALLAQAETEVDIEAGLLK